jgi:hypothetical protein
MPGAFRGVIVALSLACSTAGAQSHSNDSCHAGPETHTWLYADDGNRTVTATGTLSSVDAFDDADVGINLGKNAGNAYLQQPPGQTVDTGDVLKGEVNLHAGKSGAPGQFAALVRGKFAGGMRAIIKGEWVVDHHGDYRLWRDAGHTEIHPIRWVRASLEDPATSSNIVFLLAQDWHACRHFKTTDDDISTTLRVPIPEAADEVDLSNPGAARAKDVGSLTEQSVLDAGPDKGRSGYLVTHQGFPDAPEAQLALTLHPPLGAVPSLRPRFPGYLKQFSGGSAAIFSDTLSYQIVTDAGVKAIHVKIDATLTGSPGPHPLLGATWSSTKNGTTFVTTAFGNPVNIPFHLQGLYKPSESPEGLSWAIAVKATDEFPTTLPSPAERVFGLTRTLVNKVRRYRLTPSSVELTSKTVPNPAKPGSFCSMVTDLRATEHLLPQVNLKGKLSWRALPLAFAPVQFGTLTVGMPERIAKEVGAPATTAVAPAAPMAGSVSVTLPYRLAVDPNDDHLAHVTLDDIHSPALLVEVSGETDLGEKLSARVEVRPMCARPEAEVVTVPGTPDPRWWGIWKAVPALQAASFKRTGARSADLDGETSPLDPKSWGTGLDAKGREEQAAFLRFAVGAPLDDVDRAALKRLAGRGASLRSREGPTAKEIEGLMNDQRVVDLGSVSNGLPVRRRR